MAASGGHSVRAQSEQRFFAFYLYYDKRGCEMAASGGHSVRAQSEQRFSAFYLYYDKRGCEMAASGGHSVRAQSQQWFNTPPLGAVRASKASSPQYRLARPCGIFIIFIYVS